LDPAGTPFPFLQYPEKRRDTREMRNQIETREISDADLDTVAGGVGTVGATLSNVQGTVQGLLPSEVTGLVGQELGIVNGVVGGIVPGGLTNVAGLGL